MAASVPWMPFPFGSQIPVTPPPDTQSFPVPQQPPLSPQLLKSFTQELYGSGAMGSLKTAGLQAQMLMNQRAMSGVAAGVHAAHGTPRNMGSMGSMGMGSMGSIGGMGGMGGMGSMGSMGGMGTMGAMGSMGGMATMTRPEVKREPDERNTTSSVPKAPSTEPAASASPTAAATSTKTTNTTTTTTANTTAKAPAGAGFSATTAPSEAAAQAAAAAKLHLQSGDAANDPRYIAMASRIAAYYHQRCQAVANFQQQRCQTWANMQRQKSQEMMQAAMLVIAWYIRDRIQRRRRRQKRQFRRGLAARASQRASMKAQRVGASGTTSGRITKGESVRKWVLEVPAGSSAASANVGVGNREKPMDPEEVAFDIDRDTVSDKDTKLYNVADNLIKSQLARIDVPLMGSLSFDASDTESEEDDDDDDDGEEEEEDYAMEDYEERGPVQQVPPAEAAAASAARAGLGAGARDPPPRAAVEEEDDDDDDDEYLMEDEEYEEDDVEVSEVVHHGTGTGVDSRQHGTTTTYS